jgi:hydroxymethylpyrimidine/phosphomethylpyrimidine kinase
MSPVAITIAGSDNSAGAGIQADLKTFSHFGVYGQTVVTCVVAEVPGKVASTQPVDLDVIRGQLRLSLIHFPVSAIKTGMLYSRAIIDLVCEILESVKPRPPLVVDPVMVAGSGDRLLQPDAVNEYSSRLFSMAAVITPNLDEARVLIQEKIQSLEQMQAAAKALSQKYGVPILLKGGHLAGDAAIDVLADQHSVREFSAPFERGIVTHGTGCTYSAAIAAGLATGHPLDEAVQTAKKYITECIRRSFRWETSKGEVWALRHSWPESRA